MKLLEGRKELAEAIRDVPDFPQPGIIFKDITPLLAQPRLFKSAIDWMAEPFVGTGVDRVVGIESRGFILGAPVALELACAFIPARKEGKLPWERLTVTYSLEYGQDSLEIHVDAVQPGQKVLIVDDVLATGGTAGAAIKAVEQAGGEVVGLAFLMDLAPLNGRDQMGDRKMISLLTYG